MAIYHLEGKMISRSQGRSSVAAAAYRSASRLTDKHTGLTHDFTLKENDLLHSEILLPKDAPEWMSDREKLWNTVEEVEKRKDAQLAREFAIALPKELTVEQNIELARSFIQHEFVNLGMVADVCLHRGHSNGEEQPHIHVMLSLREITADGFGQKVRAWNDKQLMLHWREAWAEHCNVHLALHGHDVRIDHRTLEAQGIDLEPQSKLGPKDARARMARFEEHQQLAKRNGNRILSNLNLALTTLTHQQSTFTHQDIAKFVNRHTATQEQFLEVYQAVKHSPEIVHLGHDNLGRDRYTTKAMLELEKRMVQHAQSKANTKHHPVSKSVQEKKISSKNLSEEQQSALLHLLNSGDVASVIGFAGSGKSYMLGTAKEAWEAMGYRVQGMTLSGIAAENLEASSGIQSHTIANRLLHWENNRERLTHNDIIVIDEAGMIGSRQMAAILDEATLANAKVVLIGDPEQLQAIEAGAAFRAITERTGFVEMTEIRRQKETWQKDATKGLATQQTTEALIEYDKRNHIHPSLTKEAAMEALIEQWQETRANEPSKSQLILAYTRDDVKALNERARQVRREQHELGDNVEVETERGKRTFAQGDRIYFLRNEKSLKVKNGTLGTIVTIQNNHLTVQLDKQDNSNPRCVTFHLSDYNDIDYGYAATIHKSQGVTVDRSYVLASNYFDRHTTYVALSRHREGAEIFYSNSEFHDFDALAKTLSRERSKDVSLDYALIRGLQNNKIKITKTELKQPQKETTKEFLQQYKRLLKRRYQTPDLERSKTVEKILDKLAASLYKNPLHFAEAKKIEPKLSQVIQARAERILARERGFEIER